MENPISIFVASRHEEDRNYIIKMLSEQNDFFLVGIEKDESNAIIKSERLKPDVIILDLQLSGNNGIELVSIIRRRSPSSAIITLCSRDEYFQKENMNPPLSIMDSVEMFANYVYKAGISGFLQKDNIDKLALAVRNVYSGQYYISDSITVRILNIFLLTRALRTSEKNTAVLTPIERGIVTEIAKGLTDEQIAKNLHYSTGAIKNHLTEIKRKTNKKNRMQVVVYSIQYGLIKLDD